MMIRTQNRPQPNNPLINLVSEIEKLREIEFRGKIRVLDKTQIDFGGKLGFLINVVLELWMRSMEEKKKIQEMVYWKY